ncbi:hypothetical protein CSOJ01_02778 [Colletotrichum sojae]|uniref:Zinc-ribbon domain-containing protein n=1 Tax=Colletotrichum sojae TaxID=2175907 RepID=A0A8H6JPV0_9PEZI|nr:hypothetical protein CSOJ01_02778 [Colletotrichum sojae]
MQPLTNAHTSACPKCGAATAETSKTCSACGALMFLWKVYAVGTLSLVAPQEVKFEAVVAVALTRQTFRVERAK